MDRAEIDSVMDRYAEAARTYARVFAKRRGLWVHARLELEAAALEGLWRAALTYDASKGASLMTYARKRMDGCMIDWLERDVKSRRIPLRPFDGRRYDRTFDTDMIDGPKDPLAPLPAGRDRQILWLYLVCGFTQNFVASLYGVHYTRISQIVARVRRRYGANREAPCQR